MKSLTIVYTSGRKQSNVQWFVDSLMAQLKNGDSKNVRIIFVDFNCAERHEVMFGLRVPPKPTIWQGRHGLTSETWWAVSSARNTGLCLCETEWIAFLDDRCVLTPTWLQAVKEAMECEYVVFGTYEKRHGMKVENGRIVEDGTHSGIDNRLNFYAHYIQAHKDDEVWLSVPGNMAMPSHVSWAYGCSLALPTEWALRVGGFEQAVDGHSGEDTVFGAMLANNHMPMRFDPRMGVIQDRTPAECADRMRREDKGEIGTPRDKSHRVLELFHTAMHTSNRHQLLQSRQHVLAGKPFPVILDSATDWFDGEVVGPNYMKL